MAFWVVVAEVGLAAVEEAILSGLRERHELSEKELDATTLHDAAWRYARVLLATPDGVLCDEFGRVVDHPGLWAVGDVAAADENPSRRRRLESGEQAQQGDVEIADVRDAGLFALELCELMVSTDWSRKGLPKAINLRIALHAGPVYACVDPVTGQQSFTGTHVSRAARIEPITPPGQVYASQAFAALAAARGVNEFTCDYVGQTPLAKGYGTFATYHVREARTSK